MSDNFESIIGGDTQFDAWRIDKYEGLRFALINEWERFKGIYNDMERGIVSQDNREYGTGFVQVAQILEEFGLPENTKLTEELRDRILERIGIEELVREA